MVSGLTVRSVSTLDVHPWRFAFYARAFGPVIPSGGRSLVPERINPDQLNLYEWLYILYSVSLPSRASIFSCS